MRDEPVKKCNDVTQKYSSKSFRENPLVNNKGRMTGYFDVDVNERAKTMDIIST